MYGLNDRSLYVECVDNADKPYLINGMIYIAEELVTHRFERDYPYGSVSCTSFDSSKNGILLTFDRNVYRFIFIKDLFTGVRTLWNLDEVRFNILTNITDSKIDEYENDNFIKKPIFVERKGAPTDESKYIVTDYYDETSSFEVMNKEGFHYHVCNNYYTPLLWQYHRIEKLLNTAEMKKGLKSEGCKMRRKHWRKDLYLFEIRNWSSSDLEWSQSKQSFIAICHNNKVEPWIPKDDDLDAKDWVRFF